ncbi:hypothetical protein JTB14_006253 [Gonioctena quinquepunctata]|nr:hypothetical protein JTB14_006253 [Gonioctena quinquepunctata]
MQPAINGIREGSTAQVIKTHDTSDQSKGKQEYLVNYQETELEVEKRKSANREAQAEEYKEIKKPTNLGAMVHHKSAADRTEESDKEVAEGPKSPLLAKKHKNTTQAIIHTGEKEAMRRSEKAAEPRWAVERKKGTIREDTIIEAGGTVDVTVNLEKENKEHLQIWYLRNEVEGYPYISKTLEEHQVELKEVFNRLRNVGLTLKPYIFNPSEGPAYINKGLPSTKKPGVDTKLHWPLQFLQEVHQNFATIARPLHEVTKEEKGFSWGSDQQQASETLKEKLITTPVLHHFNPNKDRELRVDASTSGIGGILLQKEKNYTITELEDLVAKSNSDVDCLSRNLVLVPQKNDKNDIEDIPTFKDEELRDMQCNEKPGIHDDPNRTSQTCKKVQAMGGIQCITPYDSIEADTSLLRVSKRIPASAKSTLGFSADPFLCPGCAKKLFIGATVEEICKHCPRTCHRSSITLISEIEGETYIVTQIVCPKSTTNVPNEAYRTPGAIEVKVPCRCHLSMNKEEIILRRFPCNEELPPTAATTHIIPAAWSYLKSFVLNPKMRQSFPIFQNIQIGRWKPISISLQLRKILEVY